MANCDDKQRVVRALRKRLAIIVDEMETCLRRREQAYVLADAYLDEFDDLGAQRKSLTRALWQLLGRMARARSVGGAA